MPGVCERALPRARSAATFAAMRSKRRSALWFARVRAGLTQGELAHAVGASRQTISDLERGVSVPSVSLALAIAERVDFPVDVLFSPRALR